MGEVRAWWIWELRSEGTALFEEEENGPPAWEGEDDLDPRSHPRPGQDNLDFALDLCSEHDLAAGARLGLSYELLERGDSVYDPVPDTEAKAEWELRREGGGLAYECVAGGEWLDEAGMSRSGRFVPPPR